MSPVDADSAANAHGHPVGAMLHNPGCDFNDEILTVGAACWTRLVKRPLAD